MYSFRSMLVGFSTLILVLGSGTDQPPPGCEASTDLLSIVPVNNGEGGVTVSSGGQATEQVESVPVFRGDSLNGPCTAPQVTRHPASVTVCSGDGVALSVVANGSTPLQFQWRRDGQNIGGANKATFAIPASAPQDGGDYDVVVTNACGQAASDAAAVVVANGPCDANCDGVVDLNDTAAFMDTIARGGGCSPCAGDANGDGTVNLFDIQAFVDSLNE